MLPYFKFYVAGIAASVTLFVHIAYIRNYWEVNPYPLQRLMLAGCFVQLVGVCGFVTYLTLAIVNKQGEQLDNLRKNVLCQSVKLKISKDTFFSFTCKSFSKVLSTWFIIPPANEVFIPPANEVSGVYNEPYVRPFFRSDLAVHPSLPISNPLLL